MTTPFAKAKPRARVMRAGAESWLLATFMLLFGAALFASLPAASAVASKPSAHFTTDAQRLAAADGSERGIVRAPSRVVRAVAPKFGGGGNDLIAAGAPSVAGFAALRGVYSSAVASDARILERAFRARAPPRLRGLMPV
ncbi:MAG: hypothetical protein K8S25_03460 [Alphaproteobacteria bacterium]|nr:hypothetical protein [Alphaproteobacteria bacterium]